MILQPAVVDDNGDIILHGRQGAEIILEFKDETGATRNMTAATVTFEVGPTVNVSLTPVSGEPAQMKLTLSNTDVKAIYAAKDRRFVFMETSLPQPTPIWVGMVYVEGWVE